MIGERVLRQEDHRFLTGGGTYLADIHPPGLAHAALLRSPLAHARIRSIDVAIAVALEGVIAVFTGDDLRQHSNPVSHWMDLPGIKPLEWYVLATDKVRFVGEPLAVVVATSRYVAEDAVDLIEVDYEELDPIVNVEAGLAPDAPLLYEEWHDNVFLSTRYSNGDPGRALLNADGVLRERFTHHRVMGLPLEGHGALGHYDRANGSLLLYASNQQPHNLRTVVSDVTNLSEASIRVVSPDMGGGFGNKQHFHREELLIAVVAMLVDQPVVWTADRTESMIASIHSRQQVHDVEVAYRNDGRVLGMRARITADLGNPVLYFTGAGPPLVTAVMLPGAYDINDYEYELVCVATNKAPMGAYRGFGQPQANFTIERVMDLVAESVGLDPAEVRSRNLIPDAPRPFASPTGNLYDTGSLHTQFDTLLHALDYERVRQRNTNARGDGRLLGVGLSNLVEVSAPNLFGFCNRFGGYEMALITVQPDGHLTVHCGTKSQGQGHETTLAQVAADVLTIPVDHVHVAQGDTAILPYGMGTWGSRSAVMGGGVVLKGASQLRSKMIKIAAHMLQADPLEVTLCDGEFRAAGKITFAEVARAAYLHTYLLPAGTDPGLSLISVYDPGIADPFPDDTGRMNAATTWSSAAAGAVVEVDIATGKAVVRDFVMVHDCGRVINPMIVDGQIQGGFAQALGAVLLEALVYDDNGQPLTSSLLDYLIPTFGDVPRVQAVHLENESSVLGGFRGAGEAAIICAPAAIANGVQDALSCFGVRVRQTNLGVGAVRSMLRDAGLSFDPLDLAARTSPSGPQLL